MRYPTLIPENVSRDMIDVFGGYNHNLRIGDNEFYDMKNLSSDDYPLLGVRSKRTPANNIFGSGKNIVSLLHCGTLYSIYYKASQEYDNFFLVKDTDGDYEGVASWRSEDIESKRTIVPMGAQLIIFPDKQIINTTAQLPIPKAIDNETQAMSGTAYVYDDRPLTSFPTVQNWLTASGNQTNKSTIYVQETGFFKDLSGRTVIVGHDTPIVASNVVRILAAGSKSPYDAEHPSGRYIVLDDPITVQDGDRIYAVTLQGRVSVQPCNQEGKTYALDYVGDDIPIDPWDDFIWLDTHANPSFKRYIASQKTWQSVLYTYAKVTAPNKISNGFNVGDGVKLSGFTLPELKEFNNTSIIKGIPNEYSMVVTGIIEPVQEKNILRARDSATIVSTKDVYFLADEKLVSDYDNNADPYANKFIVVGGNLMFCLESALQADSEAFIRQDKDFTQYIKTLKTYGSGEQTASLSNNYKINISNTYISNADPDNDISEGEPVALSGSDLSTMQTIEGKEIVFGDTGKHAIIASGSVSLDGSQWSFKIDRDVTVAPNTPIYCIEHIPVSGMCAVKLELARLSGGSEKVNISVDDTACIDIDNQYVEKVENLHPIKFSRKMPVMDHVIEAGNRLWGCRYGENVDEEFVNEIYCSKLGDPTNWSVYEGLSTDSYAVSCGTDGKWTGAFNYRGYPTFFKEHYIHTIYGSNPPFQVKDTEARGIQSGSSLSLAMVNEVLFYKGIHGICAYTGGLPEEISGALGDESYHDAVACAYKGKYYVEMQDASDNPAFFVYDVKKGLWHKEEPINALQMVASDNNVFFISPVTSGNTTHQGVGSLFGNTESPVRWFAESGYFGLETPDKKYIGRLNMRIKLPVGSSVFVSIEYDSSGVWERVTNVIGYSLHPFSVSIKPKRCDHFRIKIEGIGQMTLYSICKTIEIGSDR